MQIKLKWAKESGLKSLKETSLWRQKSVEFIVTFVHQISVSKHALWVSLSTLTALNTVECSAFDWIPLIVHMQFDIGQLKCQTGFYF